MIFSLGQTEMGRIWYFLNQRYVEIKKIPNNKYFIHQIKCAHYLNEKIETHDMATIGGACIRNQDYNFKMEICIWYQYTIFHFNTPPGKKQ